jgi:hypothetical protein
MEITYFSALTDQDRYGLKDLLEKITIDVKNLENVVGTDSSYEFFYKTDRPTNDQIKTFLEGFETKKEKLNKTDKLLAVLSYDMLATGASWGGYSSGFKLDGDTYKFTFESSKRVTLDELAYILNIDIMTIPKSFWRGSLQNINLESSSKFKIMELMTKDRADIFRILGKKSGVQLTVEELKTIVALPHFSRVTSSGLIGRGETADIVNRRSIIFHQDACNDEVVIELLNSFGTNESKQSFMKSLNRKAVTEKFNDSPVVQLLTKLG